MPDLHLLDRIWFGNSVRQWLIAIATLGADIQHAVNVELVRRFGAERMEFAVPMRSLFTEPRNPVPQ